MVIGLGNPLMSDDGLGLVALERLREQWELPPEVELVDGGTWGLSLLPVIEDAGRVLFLDAVDTGTTPGTAMMVDRARIPRYLATKISPHQVDLRDALAVAELRGRLPDQIVVLGLQPERVELRNGLSQTLIEGLDGLVEAAVHLLARWGHRCVCRQPAHA